MLGRAICRLNQNQPTPWHIIRPTRSELDLTDRTAVKGFYDQNEFDLVIHAAAKVGGIKANIADPCSFYADNALINLNVIEESRLHNIPKLLFLGSSCMYPKDHGKLLEETDILAAPLEPTNEGYALSKIAAARHCAYISEQYGLAYKTLIPCNLFGEGDHFDPQNSHLIAAIILKIYQAIQNDSQTIEIWGDGTARREFLYIDDLATFILSSYETMNSFPDNLNLGYGTDHSVNDYYRICADIMGYQGDFHHNLEAPVGMMQKLMNSDCAKQYDWSPSLSVEGGIKKTYQYFLTLQGIQ